MSTATEHCGLCNVASYHLVASQWGQVCRPCLRAKHAKPGAPARAAQQARDETLREEGRQQGLREATEAAVALLRCRAVRYRASARLAEAGSLTARLQERSADVENLAANALERGEHLKEGP
jgi:hypothetical protein